jgi:hypothetical protein
MSVKFFDKQDLLNPSNGANIDGQDLSKLLASFSNRKPFFLELFAANGYKLLVGVGRDTGCVQYSSIDGKPPYLMAVASTGQANEAEIDFLIEDTITPISTHFCIPFQMVKQITSYFAETGKPDPSVSWEEI